MENATGKIDFHLHSYASNVTDYYAANAFAIPESHSDPLTLYPLLKERGMTLVTLTDHNSIEGVLEMLNAGLDDVFISAEMTTTFPEDGCNIHITIANVTPAQFNEADRLRGNVYEMVAYLDRQISEEMQNPAGNRLIYFMTHPLMSTQNRPYGREGSLRVEHIEKAILLCNTFEIQNGTRTKAINELTATLLTSLTPQAIDRLANKHGIAPKGSTPWLKAFVGGSDDHSGINPGRTWTEFQYSGARATPNALIDSIRQRETRPDGSHGGPITLAHSLLKLLYDGRKKSAASTGNRKATLVDGSVHSLLQLVFESVPEKSLERIRRKAATLRKIVVGRWRGRLHGPGVPFEQVLESETAVLLASSEFRATLASQQTTDDRIFLVISTLINRIFVRYLSNLKEQRGINLVAGIKEMVALVSSNLFVSMPYLVAFLQQASDSLVMRDVRESFQFAHPRKLALLTDTFFEVNGVSVSIKRMIGEATRRGIDFTVITCLSTEEHRKYCSNPEIRRLIDEGRLKIFTSVANLDFPEYDGFQARFPPLLEMLKYLQEGGFTKVQISTPGIIGLAGLLAAKTLQIETAATYHTNIPEYVENYTRDMSLEALAWKYVMAFYHAVDEVIVPSRSTGKLLHKRGLRKRKILLLDRWVDVNRFHPRNRVRGYWNKYGVDDESLVKFIYVGRLGVEKNLHLIASAYRQLRETRQDAHLILVGEGPYRRDLEKQLSGLPVTFTGVLEGSELAHAIASADVKLFPSTTDTWGNAPLEAQASGLPVIVSEVGGPIELMLDGVTGLKVQGRNVQELVEAMLALMDESMRSKMGRMAASFAAANRVDEPFTAILDSEAYRRRLEQRKKDRLYNPLELMPVDLVQESVEDAQFDGAILA